MFGLGCAGFLVTSSSRSACADPVDYLDIYVGQKMVSGMVWRFTAAIA